jgi:ABC-type sugar transport system substrate-binding protein
MTMTSTMSLRALAATLAAAAVAAAAVATPVAAASFLDADTIHPAETYTYVANFDAGVTATAKLWGDEASDLDLFVYDENGNLIASSDSLQSIEAAEWTPLWTGEFRIEVVNVGDAPSYYLFAAE